MVALITNKNKPSERIVAGNVNRTKSGRTIKVNKDNTTATIKDCTYPSTDTPLKKYERPKTPAAVIRSLITVFILANLNEKYRLDKFVRQALQKGV